MYTGKVLAGTPLQDAVAEYNTQAQLLQAMWDTHQATQSAAFDCYSDAYNHLREYIMADNIEEMHNEWAAYLLAWTELENVTAPPANGAFNAYAVLLENIADALQCVFDCDQTDLFSVAYDTGYVHFSFPDQPVPFWREDGNITWLEYPEVEIPILAVGDAQTYTSISSAQLWRWISWVYGLVGWASFGIWAANRLDDVEEMNASMASDFDELCIACQCGITASLIDKGYTSEELARFCDENNNPAEHEGSCPCLELGSSDDAEKAGLVRLAIPDSRLTDLQELDDSAYEHISPIWYEQLDPTPFD